MLLTSIFNLHLFRTELAQIQQTLRTKAMREKQEQKEMKKYRYALIRIRFPEGIFLQVQIFFFYF